MANFPGSLPSIPTSSAAQTLAAAGGIGHTALHGLINGEILAIATKMGTGSSTPAAGKVLRGTGVGTSGWGAVDLATDITGSLPVANAGLVLATIYPIGCIYTETTGVNPATTFGFGSWSAFGAGRVLVGNGTSDQVFNAGDTGGESNHTLTGAESGTSVHGHNVTDPTHIHTTTNNAFNNSDTPTTGASNGLRLNATGNANLAVTVAAASTGLTVNNSSAANASNAHNNLQPYVVVYFWKRTA